MRVLILCFVLPIAYVFPLGTQAGQYSEELYCIGLLNASAKLLREHDRSRSISYITAAKKLDKITREVFSNKDMGADEIGSLMTGAASYNAEAFDGKSKKQKREYMKQKADETAACLDLANISQ